MTVRNPRRARGFTLIELLVVIGVILVLVGIAAYAFTRLDPTEKATRANLENAKAMLAELESTAGWGEIERVNGTADPETEMYRAMFKIPANRTALQRLGPKAVRQQTATTDVPRLLDGWGNVIKYYLSSGSTSTLTVNLGQKADGSWTLTGQNVRSPDSRPFFASPGPDGDMGKGDDNIYSFEL